MSISDEASSLVNAFSALGINTTITEEAMPQGGHTLTIELEQWALEYDLSVTSQGGKVTVTTKFTR